MKTAIRWAVDLLKTAGLFFLAVAIGSAIGVAIRSCLDWIATP